LAFVLRKAPEDWRTPKRSAPHGAAKKLAPAFWSAVALHRFGRVGKRQKAAALQNLTAMPMSISIMQLIAQAGFPK